MQEPPLTAEPAPLDFPSFIMVVPVGVSMDGMLMMFDMTSRSSMMYVMGGAIFVAMLTIGIVQMGRNGAERKQKMRSERRDCSASMPQVVQSSTWLAARAPARVLPWNRSASNTEPLWTQSSNGSGSRMIPTLITSAMASRRSRMSCVARKVRSCQAAEAWW